MKVIIDGFISVDYFAKKKGLEAFFLTHAHSDHLHGLTHRWDFAHIYCSPVTAKLIPLLIREGEKFATKWIVPLELNICHQMDGFSVTLLDASHVPGAVMYLFNGPRISDGCVLCTGDFRADNSFYAHTSTLLHLQKQIIDRIYLDNTYLDSISLEFPSREESVEEAKKYIDSLDPTTQIRILVNNLGREDFLVKLSILVKEKIFLNSPVRNKVVNALNINEHFAKNAEETRIQTCFKWNCRKIFNEENCVILEPTMLYSQKNIVPKKSNGFHIIRYSDHCSPNELHDFLSLLRFRKVTGVVLPIFPRQLSKLLELSLPLSNENAEKIIHECEDCCQVITSISESINEEGTISSSEAFAENFLKNLEKFIGMDAVMPDSCDVICIDEMRTAALKNLNPQDIVEQLMDNDEKSSSTEEGGFVKDLHEFQENFDISACMNDWDEEIRANYFASSAYVHHSNDNNPLEYRVRFDANKGQIVLTESLKKALAKLTS